MRKTDQKWKQEETVKKCRKN